MSESSPSPTGDHRFWAVTTNNRAWDLIEAGERTEAETEEMIHVAHASYWHWLHAGDALNRQRAENLLTTAYVRAGRAEPAVIHAQRCLKLSEQNHDAETAFDRACILGCAAHAYDLSVRQSTGSDPSAARAAADDLFQQLDQALLSIVDDDERDLVKALYPPKD